MVIKFLRIVISWIVVICLMSFALQLMTEPSTIFNIFGLLLLVCVIPVIAYKLLIKYIINIYKNLEK